MRPLSLESGGTAPALIAARRAAQDLQFCLLGGVFALLDCLYFFGVRYTVTACLGYAVERFGGCISCFSRRTPAFATHTRLMRAHLGARAQKRAVERARATP